MELNAAEKITVFLTTHYMEEADKVASRIAIIDHGKIVALGSSEELQKRTSTESLEDAFIALTGGGIRDEEASPLDQFRMHRQALDRRK